MREGAAEIFYRRAQRDKDVLLSKIVQIPADGSLSTVKDPIGQVLYGQQTTLIKGFLADSLDLMSSQSSYTVLLSNLEVFFIVIECQGNCNLFRFRYRLTDSSLNSKYLQSNLAWP